MVKVSFVTHLPMKMGSPYIQNISNTPLTVVLSSQTDKIDPISVDLNPGEYFTSPYQYYIDWNIKVWGVDPTINQLIPGGKTILWEYNMDLTGQVVFIKMDAYALGDNLAWLPQVDAFQQKHNCKIICSTFHNHLFVDVYPNIMFVQPNTKIENVFAQYYIGTHDDTPPMYSPTTYIEEPLQKVAADILGLEYEDLKCRVAHWPKQKNPKKICLSQYASLDMKTWHGDWQKVVDTLVEKGYEVHVISREFNALKNVVDKSGNFPLEQRVAELADASYFIGVSSGLSWLAHSLDCHVFLISDFTPPNHEFLSNVTRIYGEGIRHKIKYEPIEKEVSTEEVIKKIKSKLRI
jgi:autotransporter strand-loop-strand O-heptosyltransferase